MIGSNLPDFDGHEAVHLLEDDATGLRAVIAVHSTELGPAAGGCRRWHYPSVEAAVSDALRLSRGMSYKNALAGLPFGGGKAVIMAERGVTATPSEFRAFGDFVESLKGGYVTAEDVGVSTEDMRVVRERTAYVSGLPQVSNEAGGDPSPWTALGVFLSLREAVRRELGKSSLDGVTVAVQGVGHVGYHLCRLLHADGARLLVADVNDALCQRAVRDFDATVVPTDEIHRVSADVFAPCALGGVLNDSSIPELAARIVAGAANNQFATAADAIRLHARGVLQLPDYLINAGGIIAVAREYLGGFTRQQVKAEVEEIAPRLGRLLDQATQEGVPPTHVADRTARALIGSKNKEAPALAVDVA